MTQTFMQTHVAHANSHMKWRCRLVLHT